MERTPFHFLQKQLVEKNRKKKRRAARGIVPMASAATYFVFMNFDPEYERLRKNHSKQDVLDRYLSSKHDKLLAGVLEPNTYKKKFSLVIVDGFAVDITDEQAQLLRSIKEVRIVEKNQELE